jgi:hypothetical protein
MEEAEQGPVRAAAGPLCQGKEKEIGPCGLSKKTAGRVGGGANRLMRSSDVHQTPVLDHHRVPLKYTVSPTSPDVPSAVTFLLISCPTLDEYRST